MITITTTAKLQTEAGITASVQSSMVGRSEGVTLATGEVAIDHSDISSWNLDTTKGAAFLLDVMSLINSGTSGEIKAVHIQCRTIKMEPSQTEYPVPIEINLGGTALGSMSQLTLSGLEGFTQATLQVSSVQVPADRRAVLTVVFAVDKT